MVDHHPTITTSTLGRLVDITAAAKGETLYLGWFVTKSCVECLTRLTLRETVGLFLSHTDDLPWPEHPHAATSSSSASPLPQ